MDSITNPAVTSPESYQSPLAGSTEERGSVYVVLKNFLSHVPGDKVTTSDLKSCDVPWLLQSRAIKLSGLEADKPTYEELVAEIQDMQNRLETVQAENEYIRGQYATLHKESEQFREEAMKRSIISATEINRLRAAAGSINPGEGIVNGVSQVPFTMGTDPITADPVAPTPSTITATQRQNRPAILPPPGKLGTGNPVPVRNVVPHVS